MKQRKQSEPCCGADSEAHTEGLHGERRGPAGSVDPGSIAMSEATRTERAVLLEERHNWCRQTEGLHGEGRGPQGPLTLAAFPCNGCCIPAHATWGAYCIPRHKDNSRPTLGAAWGGTGPGLGPKQYQGAAYCLQVNGYKLMGAASLHKSMSIVSLYRSMGAASLHKSMGAASLHKSNGWVLHPCSCQVLPPHTMNCGPRGYQCPTRVRY